MRILPDGTVEIKSNTGETKIVKPEDLPSYGIPYSTFETELKSFKNVGGDTKLLDPTEQSKVQSDQVALQNKNSKVSKAAQDYLEVYNTLKSKGDLTSDKAKQELAFAAGKYNTIAGFGEGGKVLSAAELGILAPTLIKTERQRGQNLIEKWTGLQPEMTLGRLQESPETAAQKMVLALQNTNPDLAKQYEGLTKELSTPTQSGNALQNAPGDVKNIINGMLGLPGQMFQQAQQMEQGPGGINSSGGYDPLQRILQSAKMTVAPEVGYVQNLNKDIGQPLQGGDVLGRAGQNFNQRPVSTILDLLPFLTAGRGKTPVETPSEVAPLESVNPVQNLTRQVTDVISGGGSKEYIARAAKNPNALPQNQVLLEEGILKHPTVTGKITATAKSMERVGSQIGDIYKGNSQSISGLEIGKILDKQLIEAGYDTKDIATIKTYLNKQGNFDITSADSQIPQEKAWQAARKIENAPPKTTNAKTNPIILKELSKEASRIIRDYLAKKNPQVVPLNARYSALADYQYNVLKDPQGIAASGGMFNIAGKAIKAGGDTSLNYLYQILGLGKNGQFQPRTSNQSVVSPLPESANPIRYVNAPQENLPIVNPPSNKILLDRRYRQGNVRFRK
jgi:hypothetical protein